MLFRSELWPLARAVHEACLRSGADGVMTIVKYSESRDPALQSTIQSLTGKFRA